MTITTESAFEANILAHGWHSLTPAAYDRKIGVFGEEDVVDDSTIAGRSAC